MIKKTKTLKILEGHYKDLGPMNSRHMIHISKMISHLIQAQNLKELSQLIDACNGWVGQASSA